MPDGKTHDKITILVLPILIVILFLMHLELGIILLISTSYLFASYMFNGDLDIYSRPYRRWSILRFIWKPYQHTFSHRSVFTHGLIIGTIIRLIYLLVIPIIIMVFLGINISIFFSPFAFLIYFGLELGSAIHTIADKTYSFFK